MDFKPLYDYILNLDNSIRFVGFIDDIGRLVYGGMKPGVLSLEGKIDSINLYMEYALINKIHSDFDSTLGKIIYSLTIREKITILTFPLKQHVLRISLERQSNHDKIINSILDYLKKGYV